MLGTMTQTTQSKASPLAPTADDARARADSAGQRDQRSLDAAAMPAKRSRRRFDDIF